MKILSRDPFAREDVIRETVETDFSCEWCGSRKNNRRLFRYGVWTDSPDKKHWQSKLFCSVGCMRSYQP
jgi:hypothetical protein